MSAAASITPEHVCDDCERRCVCGHKSGEHSPADDSCAVDGCECISFASADEAETTAPSLA